MKVKAEIFKVKSGVTCALVNGWFLYWGDRSKKWIRLFYQREAGELYEEAKRKGDVYDGWIKIEQQEGNNMSKCQHDWSDLKPPFGERQCNKCGELLSAIHDMKSKPVTIKTAIAAYVIVSGVILASMAALVVFG